MKKKMKDLSGDGKITKKDVLIGRGVIARKKGGMAKSSAQTSVIKGASVGGSREGSTIKGPKAKGSREGSVIKAKKGTHVTKDGRTAKKGLYYNMNKRKQAGTSRPGKGTVSAKALKQSAKTAFKPKKKS
jgi:hypothetical protein